MITEQTARELIEAARCYMASMGAPVACDFVHPQAFADAIDTHIKLRAALARAEKEAGNG